MKLVDKNIKEPLHIQLSNIIKEMIENNELKEGSYLISERDICKIQNISRMTVNKSIINLVNEGLLERKQGRGTFVAYKKTKLTYEKLQGFTEISKENKLEVYSKILSFNVSENTDFIRKKLKANAKDLVFEIERIRYIDNDPTILEKVYILKSMCPTLTKELVDKNSLYKLYRNEYFHKIKRAKQTINPVILSKDESKILIAQAKSLALKIDRVVYTENDDVMEYTSSLFITDKHEYEVVLNEY